MAQVVRGSRSKATARSIRPFRRRHSIRGHRICCLVARTHGHDNRWCGIAASSPGRNPQTAERFLQAKFENKSTEVWFGAHPFLRSHQIKGVPDDLAKELCSRHLAKGMRGDGKKICVENKRSYKDREGKSPDQSDSFLGLVDFCRDRLGFECSEHTLIRGQMNGTPLGNDA